jgi:hypothetical protein
MQYGCDHDQVEAQMANLSKIALVIASLVSNAIPSFAEQKQYVFCVADYESNCPQHDFFYDCRPTIRPEVQKICSITNGTGQHSEQKLQDKSGGKCGVMTYLITCN